MLLRSLCHKNAVETCWGCWKTVVAIEAAFRMGVGRLEIPTGRCFVVLSHRRPKLSSKNVNDFGILGPIFDRTLRGDAWGDLDETPGKLLR